MGASLYSASIQASTGYFAPDSLNQQIGPEFSQCITGSAKLIGKLLSQSLIEAGMLHIDDHRLDLVLLNLPGNEVGFLLRRQVSHGDVARAIGQDDHHGHGIGMGKPLTLHDVIGQSQTG